MPAHLSVPAHGVEDFSDQNLVKSFTTSAAAVASAIAEKSNGVTQAFAADLTPTQAIGRGMSLLNSTTLFAGIVGLGGAGYLINGLRFPA